MHYSRNDIVIRQATKADWEIIWPIIYEVLKGGETYPYSPNTPKSDAFKFWMQIPHFTYIALSAGKAVGTYYLKPNQPGLGSHICNAGYMVSSHARGKGVGKQMCLHSISEAKRIGYLAMQYNCVVSTNTKAVRLWQDLGFDIIGRIPKAFKHYNHGLVDAYIMYQELL